MRKTLIAMTAVFVLLSMMLLTIIGCGADDGVSSNGSTFYETEETIDSETATSLFDVDHEKIVEYAKGNIDLQEFEQLFPIYPGLTGNVNFSVDTTQHTHSESGRIVNSSTVIADYCYADSDEDLLEAWLTSIFEESTLPGYAGGWRYDEREDMLLSIDIGTRCPNSSTSEKLIRYEVYFWEERDPW